jgi:hypothetical protein
MSGDGFSYYSLNQSFVFDAEIRERKRIGDGQAAASGQL